MRAPALLLWAALGAAACGPAKPGAATALNGRARGDESVRVLSGKPPIAVLSRDGDPKGAVAVAIATGGLAPSAQPAVALAGVLEARLRARGLADATVIPAWDGYRAQWLAAEADATASVEAIRTALLAPITEADLAAAERKITALGARPLRDVALLDSARCTGEPFSTRDREPLTLERLEAWRKAAHGLGRVALAAVGSDAFGEAVAAALERGAPWPAAPKKAEGEPLPPGDAPVDVYDATGDLGAGAARITIAVHTPSAAQSLGAAPLLGAPRGPLASRLGALDVPARVRDVTATAHARGGCLSVTIEAPPPHAGVDPAIHLATLVALARQEIGVEIADGGADASVGRASAKRAGDPREAAARAAWWALSEDREDPIRLSTAIGLSQGRDAPPAASGAAAGAEGAIRSAVDRATVAWQTPVLDTRSRVERGQGEAWMLLASPCGTAPEAESDAGLGAAFALASSERARESGVSAEPWVTPEGLGVIVHGGALTGETPLAHARRIADALARPFAADPVDLGAVARARAELLRGSEQDDMRALASIAGALAPGHPSWLSPFGTAEALGRSSDAAILARASALRAGPLRAAILATADAAQADAAARAIDRWIARRPGEARACPVPATAPAPRPGTYAVERANAPLAEAWIAAPLPAGDADARAAASWLATALDGEGGLMARALTGLARSWSARVLGPPRASALVMRVATAHGALDAAVAQLRALVDRLRQGALSEADRARAAQIRDRDALDASLDPKSRLAALWRGEPTPAAPALDAMRSLCANVMKDDGLVIVATRPGHGR
jgi:hypothetical protein